MSSYIHILIFVKKFPLLHELDFIDFFSLPYFFFSLFLFLNI
jgi:hypothetical protein